MWIFDTLKNWVKKGTDTVIDTTAKVGNFMEEKSATLVEKVPGGHDLKVKAEKYTEQAVDRVGNETKDMIKEWQDFIESHLKKADTPETTTVSPTEATASPVAEPEKKVVEKEATEPKKSHSHKKK